MTLCYGWVKFPIDDPRWEDTGEGGMFIKLVVVPPDDFNYKWWKASGASYIRDLLVECLIGDDKRQNPDFQVGELDARGLLEWERARDKWLEYHYPHANRPWSNGVPAYDMIRHVSTYYMAAVVLGATSWSGWDKETTAYWQCTFDDLTPEGQQLYRMLEKLYPDCQLHLLTFLDT